MEEEYKALMGLLALLKEQYEIILSDDCISLDMITERINDANKLIAQKELERRSFLNNNKITLKSIIKDDVELDKQHKDIKALVASLQGQKEANEQMLKQRLNFTNKILTLINPDRSITTYDAMGHFRR